MKQKQQTTRKTLINWLGLLGVVGLLSYTAGVVFSPLAYPGYDWKAQAVSDLFAMNAPSLLLWNQLTSLCGTCVMVSVMSVCVFIQNKLNRTLRAGIYLFAAMQWVSTVGYAMFPLAEGGMEGTSFQDIMHIVVTALVVLLSVASMIVIMIGSFRKRRYPSLGIWAALTLALMLAGAIGVNLVPPGYFGIPERFSVFAGMGFAAVLGIYLFRGFSFDG
ncbi:DUF998 domain-containing protein [Clostridiaceae bacterium OttesenSCG-928-D20]|nr:DUF998 domain-containing protein [Clostridiaceae bacterium OttesenSCG-928-D20]